MGVDLFYTDAAHTPQGILKEAVFDVAFGSGENDFELEVPSSYRLEAGAYVYVPATEYGGIIDECVPATDGSTITYKGRSWHGMLEYKILEPNAGADYLVVQGDASSILSAIISRIGLTELFTVPLGASGIQISSYQFDRYTDAYTGITKMLSQAGARLHCSWENGRVVLSAIPINTIELSDGAGRISIDEILQPTNHLICLGKGELKNREVIHFYADSQGRVSRTQTLRGLYEVTETYDYSNAEGNELSVKGREQLEARQKLSKASLTDVGGVGDVAFVGDIFHAFDPVSGAEASAKIVKKVAKIAADGDLSVSYETGAEKGSVSKGSSSTSSSDSLSYIAGEGIRINGVTISADVTNENLTRLESDISQVRTQASNASSTAAAARDSADAAIATVDVAAPLASARAGRKLTLSVLSANASQAGTMSANDKEKLDSISFGANAYTLPQASAEQLGGITVGDGLSAENGRLSASVRSVAGRTGDVTLAKSDVGLALIDNTPDRQKHVASADRLYTRRLITISGAVNGSAYFDGSSNITITTTGAQASASFLAAHPVGCYFETSDGTYNPNANGGTWELMRGRVGAYKWHRIALVRQWADTPARRMECQLFLLTSKDLIGGLWPKPKATYSSFAIAVARPSTLR